MNIFHHCSEEMVLFLNDGWTRKIGRGNKEDFENVLKLQITFSTFVLALLNNFRNRNTTLDFLEGFESV